MAEQTPPETSAYREAGHAVISYLIRGGYTDQHIPIDRSLILPSFDRVSIAGESADWGNITNGLGSLITAPQVLVAGIAVDQIRGATVTPETLRTSAMAERAFDLLGSYIEEYGEENGRERDRKAWEWLDEMYPYVVEMLQLYWKSVEGLAQALLVSKTLTEPQAFAVIEQSISGTVREQAKARVQGDADNYTQNVLKMLYEANPEAFIESIKRVEAKQAKPSHVAHNSKRAAPRQGKPKRWWWPF